MATLTPEQYAALRVELTTDPKGLGYGPLLDKQVLCPWETLPDGQIVPLVGEERLDESRWTLEREPDDAGIAELLNARDGLGAERVPVASLSRDDFLRAALPMTVALAGKDAAIQAKWDRILAFAQSASSVSVASDSVRNLFMMAKADGLLDDEAITSLTTKVGSRAESLLGVGTSVSAQDVGHARNGGV